MVTSYRKSGPEARNCPRRRRLLPMPSVSPSGHRSKTMGPDRATSSKVPSLFLRSALEGLRRSDRFAAVCRLLASLARPANAQSGRSGAGLHRLAKEIHAGLESDDFWTLVERLSTGRRLVITGDHGYAATGLFPDLIDKDQVSYLKSLFKSGRSSGSPADDGSWVPPVDLRLATAHGNHAYVLGRRKWKSAAGYPTLQHGGLSLLEVLVPFIELSK